jgi:DNA-binding FadR family transcriptional regulator
MEELEFFQYLHQMTQVNPEVDKLPALKDLSAELGLSISTLREQMGVAKALGLVDVRPRLGIRTLPYSFTPAVDASLCYAIKQDSAYFEDFVDLRRHLEYAYFPQAIELLEESDHKKLTKLVQSAWDKLRGSPVRIPHEEHRQLHITIFNRLHNVFVTGLLEAYWDAYEAVGLNVYADLDYLEQVWTYHEQLADAAIKKDKTRGLKILREHFDLMDEMLT